jgi:hypothetical protein
MIRRLASIVLLLLLAGPVAAATFPVTVDDAVLADYLAQQARGARISSPTPRPPLSPAATVQGIVDRALAPSAERVQAGGRATACAKFKALPAADRAALVAKLGGSPC